VLYRWKQSLTGFIISSIIIVFIIPPSMLQSQRFVLQPNLSEVDTVSRYDLEETRQVINQRLQGLDMPDWSQAIVKDNRLMVTVPNSVDQTELIDRLLQNQPVALIETGVEFPSVDGHSQVRIGPTADPDQNIYQQLLGNHDFVRAEAVADAGGLDITLTPAGAERFAAFMTDRYGVYLCLTQDSVVIGCPIVRLVDQARLEIRPGPVEFLVEETALIEQINAGQLPIPLRVDN